MIGTRQKELLKTMISAPTAERRYMLMTGTFQAPTVLLMNRVTPTKSRATALPTPRTLRAA